MCVSSFHEGKLLLTLDKLTLKLTFSNGHTFFVEQNFKKLDQMPTSEMTAGDIDECVSSCALSPHWSERAMKELNETPDTVRESLAALRKLIAGKLMMENIAIQKVTS